MLKRSSGFRCKHICNPLRCFARSDGMNGARHWIRLSRSRLIGARGRFIYGTRSGGEMEKTKTLTTMLTAFTSDSRRSTCNRTGPTPIHLKLITSELAMPGGYVTRQAFHVISTPSELATHGASIFAVPNSPMQHVQLPTRQILRDFRNQSPVVGRCVGRERAVRTRL